MVRRMRKNKILIVDDEPAIRSMIAMTLELNGFEYLEAENAQTAHNLVVDERPDLILLDWLMPGISGIELARRLRRDNLTSDIPIIMITAKGAESNKVEGLDTGADDYITKPFSTKELLSRIRAVLRRSETQSEVPVIDVNGLIIDSSAHRASAHGKQLKLGPTEFNLLQFFMNHPERAFTREQLLDQVWGSNVYVDNRTVDVHILRLRKILARHGFDKFIQTVRGTGYRFSTDSN